MAAMLPLGRVIRPALLPRRRPPRATLMVGAARKPRGTSHRAARLDDAPLAAGGYNGYCSAASFACGGQPFRPQSSPVLIGRSVFNPCTAGCAENCSLQCRSARTMASIPMHLLRAPEPHQFRIAEQLIMSITTSSGPAWGRKDTLIERNQSKYFPNSPELILLEFEIHRSKNSPACTRRG